MNNCKNCAYAIFNQVWGEYKCEIKETSVKPSKNNNCVDYEKGEPSISKDDVEVEDE